MPDRSAGGYGVGSNVCKIETTLTLTVSIRLISLGTATCGSAPTLSRLSAFDSTPSEHRAAAGECGADTGGALEGLQT
jgi:hypothetical protein